MEGERISESKDETGFSEKRLDINIEIGVFNKGKTKVKKTKVLFENKAKK